MKKLLKLIVSATCLANLATAQTAIVDYQFGDDDGTAAHTSALNGANSTNPASWNFWLGQTQGGYANYGYTNYYKNDNVDQSASATQAYRTLTFANELSSDNALASSKVSQYVFTIDFKDWDLRQNWDATSGSAPGKGIQFTLGSSSSSTAMIGFETTANYNGFKAVSMGANASYVELGVGTSNEASGGLLQINGDLSTGTWSAQAKTGDDATWSALGTGTGLTSISTIVLAARSPAEGSWGGGDDLGTYSTDATAGGTWGDYMRIDSMTLTAVPEPSSYALIAGMLALASIIVRRHK